MIRMDLDTQHDDLLDDLREQECATIVKLARDAVGRSLELPVVFATEWRPREDDQCQPIIDNKLH